MDALVARALPRALPQATPQREPAPGENSGVPETGGNSGLAVGEPSGKGNERISGPSDSATVNSAMPGSAQVRRFTVRGPCAPLRLGLALLEGVRDDAARSEGRRPLADAATVRWTPEGALEVLLHVVG